MLMVEMKLRTHLEVDLVVEVVCKCIYEVKKICSNCIEYSKCQCAVVMLMLHNN